jgi:hypothetical protein
VLDESLQPSQPDEEYIQMTKALADNARKCYQNMGDLAPD